MLHIYIPLYCICRFQYCLCSSIFYELLLQRCFLNLWFFFLFLNFGHWSRCQRLFLVFWLTSLCVRGDCTVSSLIWIPGLLPTHYISLVWLLASMPLLFLKLARCAEISFHGTKSKKLHLLFCDVQPNDATCCFSSAPDILDKIKMRQSALQKKVHGKSNKTFLEARKCHHIIFTEARKVEETGKYMF